MMSRKTVATALLGALLFALGSSSQSARATTASHKQYAHPTQAVTEALGKAFARHNAIKISPSLALVSKTPNDAPDFDYQSRIQEAQALLASQQVLKDDMRFDDKGTLAHFGWLLAVGKKTGPLTVLRMDEAGTNDQGFTVNWPINNFINTRFSVTKPEGYIVFAQRRPVHAGQGFREAVYTAYSPELDTKTMRDAGMQYLRGLQRQAYDRIKEQDVRSRVAPALTVAQEIPASMVLRLMITEHVDPLHMKYVGMEQCVHEVLFTLAANGNHAYAYAKSSAGALGLPQFMAATYQMVRTNYPAAGLEPDFELGMGNLQNAVSASILLLDLELTQLPRDTLKRFSSSSQQFAAFLAAGYNRNPVHVLATYAKTHTLTGGNAPFENKMYVRIQSWVGAFLKRKYGLA